MPEFTVLKKFEKEARLHASDMGSSGLPASNPAKYGECYSLCVVVSISNHSAGRLGVFPDTLARPSGARQSVTIHSPPPKDPYFLPITKPRNTQKKKKSAWTTSKRATIASCTRCPKVELPSLHFAVHHLMFYLISRHRKSQNHQINYLGRC